MDVENFELKTISPFEDQEQGGGGESEGSGGGEKGKRGFHRSKSNVIQTIRQKLNRSSQIINRNSSLHLDDSESIERRSGVEDDGRSFSVNNPLSPNNDANFEM